jgi:hypothetical protein
MDSPWLVSRRTSRSIYSTPGSKPKLKQRALTHLKMVNGEPGIGGGHADPASGTTALFSEQINNLKTFIHGASLHPGALGTSLHPIDPINTGNTLNPTPASLSGRKRGHNADASSAHIKNDLLTL